MAMLLSVLAQALSGKNAWRGKAASWGGLGKRWRASS